MTTDPGLIPALAWWEHGDTRAVTRDSRGPERVTTEDPPDDWTPPRPVGFLAMANRYADAVEQQVRAVIDQGREQRDPLRWEGDDS